MTKAEAAVVRAAMRWGKAMMFAAEKPDPTGILFNAEMALARAIERLAAARKGKRK